MKKIPLLTAAFASLVPMQALADGHESQGWNVSLGLGALYQPTYLGDDESEAIAFPNIRVTYGDRFAAGLDGVHYSVLSSGAWKAGPVLAYDFGRDEDAGDDGDLLGLGDIDGTIELGGFVEYELDKFSARLEVRQGVDGGHDGMIAQAEAKYRGGFQVAGRQAFFSVGPELVFGDDNYNSTFFDVSADQSAASGIGQYDAGAGIISYGIHATAVMPMTEQTSLIGFVGIDQLAGEVGDSTIVSERGSKDQASAGLMINYSF